MGRGCFANHGDKRGKAVSAVPVDGVFRPHHHAEGAALVAIPFGIGVQLTAEKICRVAEDTTIVLETMHVGGCGRCRSPWTCRFDGHSGSKEI
jgi:hypothetical protein